MTKFRSILILAVILVIIILFARNYKGAFNFGASAPAGQVSDEIFGNYLSASVAQKTNDYSLAIESFEKVLMNAPENREVTGRLYALYLYEGEYEKAMEHSNREIEINKLRKVDWAEASPIPYILASIKNFKEGDVKTIPSLLEPLADPKIPDRTHIDAVVLPIILAWSYAVDDNFKQAFKVIDSITADYMLSIFSYNRALINDLANNKPLNIKELEGKPVNQVALHFIAEMFYEIGNFSLSSAQLEEAAIYLRIAKFIDPKDFKYTSLLGVVLESQGRFEKAIEIYSEVEKDSKNYEQAMLAKAITLSRFEKNAEALKLLNKFKTEDNILKFKAKFTAGSIYLSDEKYDDAVRELKAAVDLIEKPSQEHWAVYFNLGVAQDKAGKWQDAEQNLKTSVSLFPRNPETLNYLAYSWLIKNKNIKQSRKMLEAAVIASGGASHILDSYGWALYKIGLFQQALPFLEQASVTLPYNAVINDHLGDLYWKLGRKREAKYLWKRALDNYNKEASVEVSEQELKSKIEKGL